jgi:hypothetical protein
MLDQKHTIAAIEHHPAHAERHAAGKPPVHVKQPAQRRLETTAQTLKIHDAQAPGSRDFVIRSRMILAS